MEEKIKLALKAAGLPESLHTLITVQKETDIEGSVNALKESITAASQSEVDRRVTQAVQTAIVNYEKKNNLKDGKPITQTPTTQEPPKTETTPPPNSELAELRKMVTELVQTVQGQQLKLSAQERQVKIQKSLADAKIPEALQKRFTVADDASDEDVAKAITAYKQELIDAGIASLKAPGQGTGGNFFEDTAITAAEARNTGASNVVGVKGKVI